MERRQTLWGAATCYLRQPPATSGSRYTAAAILGLQASPLFS